MFGPHVNRYHAAGRAAKIAAHIEAARQEAEVGSGFRVGAVSIFVSNPHAQQVTLGPVEAAGLKDYIGATGVRVIAHSTYAASPWKGDPAAAAHIRREAEACQAAGIEGLVVHLPKQPPAAVLAVAGRLLSPGAPGVRIYLETPAVTPRETWYETPEKLEGLFRQLRAAHDPGLDRFGLCVDTAHLWTSGIDLRAYADAEQWFGRLDRAAATIPPAAVMLHLNDSKRARGVGPDAHEALARGHIWGGRGEGREADSGLAAVVDYAVRHGVPTILERKPKEELAWDYTLLRRLAPSLAAK